MIIDNIDRWDKREFTEALEYNQELRHTEQAGSSRVHGFAELMLDIFSGLYKYEPKVREPADRSEAWEHKVYCEISQLQEWKQLRERTKMNPEAAAAATAQFCQDIVKALPPKPDAGAAGGGGGNLDMPLIRRTAREAAQEAAEKADETNEQLMGFGYGTGESLGRPKYDSPSQKREVAKRLYNNRTLQQIAELAGRMRRIAAAKQKAKVKHGVDELADITVGDDLARLTPAEVMKLSHPALKLDFQKKLLERQLMQYKLRGREPQGRGPVVVCIDESGSMQGTKDVWAKAVGLALLQIAQQQRRAYAMVHFNTHVVRTDRFEGKADPGDIMDAVCTFAGGGTAYEPPLETALKTITKDANYKRADIVFITDGECALEQDFLDRFNKERKDREIHVISVVIQDTGRICAQFSNKVVTISDLKADDKALDAMFTI